MSGPGAVIAFMGPGRSGTTSLYHAFRAAPAYRLDAEKEGGALSFAFPAREAALRRLVRGGVYVELTPSNLLAARAVAANVARLAPGLARYVVIRRPVAERMVSLYLHHAKLGRDTGSFDAYVARSAAFAEAWDGWYDGTADIVFGGLAEYQPRLLAPLPPGQVVVIDFARLFPEVNAMLAGLGLPPIAEIRRNRGYAPRNRALHRLLVSAYRAAGLGRVPGIEALKSLYMSVNARSGPVAMSPATRRLLDAHEADWTAALEGYRHAA